MKSVLDIIKTETLDPPARVTDVMTLIRGRHTDRVQAMVYYGSSLRELDNPEKMLDFYVLVDSYRKTHGAGPRAFINRFIPPAVYYVEHPSDDGTISTCKYSILSLSEFEKRCSSRAFLSQVWGRFSQPCACFDRTRRPTTGDSCEELFTEYYSAGWQQQYAIRDKKQRQYDNDWYQCQRFNAIRYDIVN